MDDSKMDVMTCLLYKDSTEGNSQWAGQYGLADGKCEGHSRAESDRIRSEGGALKDRRMKSPIEDRWDGSWLKCRPVGKCSEFKRRSGGEFVSRAFRVVLGEIRLT